MAPWIVLGVVALMFVVIYSIGRWMIRIRTAERIHCPNRDQDLEVESIWSADATWGPGKRIDIACCAAFDDPEHVTCSKDCLATRPAGNTEIRAAL